MSGWNYEVKDNSDYLKINPDSTVTLRLVSEPFCYMASFKDGSTRESFGFLVILKPVNPADKTPETVKVWEIGPGIFRTLKGYLENPVWGDPSKYDLYIMRRGSGLDTKYEIQPSPNKGEITDAQKALIAAANIDLKAMCLRGGKPHEGVQQPAAPAHYNPFADE